MILNGKAVGHFDCLLAISEMLFDLETYLTEMQQQALVSFPVFGI